MPDLKVAVDNMVDLGYLGEHNPPLVTQKEPIYGWTKVGLWYYGGHVVPRYMRSMFLSSNKGNVAERLGVKQMFFNSDYYIQSLASGNPYLLNQSTSVNRLQETPDRLCYVGGLHSGSPVFGFDKSLDGVDSWQSLIWSWVSAVPNTLNHYNTFSPAAHSEASNEFGMMWEMSGYVLSVGQLLFPEYASPVAIKPPLRCAYCSSPEIRCYFERPEMKANPSRDLIALCESHAPPKTRSAFVGLDMQTVGDLLNVRAVDNPSNDKISEGVPSEQEQGVVVND